MTDYIFRCKSLFNHVYSGSCDMRKGFDGLSGLVRNQFKADPLMNDVFVFLSRTKNRIKILHWQGDGFASNIKLKKCIHAFVLKSFRGPSVNFCALRGKITRLRINYKP